MNIVQHLKHISLRPKLCLPQLPLRPVTAKLSAAKSRTDFVKNGQSSAPLGLGMFVSLTDVSRSSNLLYPKEDRNTSTLLYICKACHATTTHDSACTYRQQLGATVQETAGVTTDVANDPTVGSAPSELLLPCLCTLCGEQLRCKECGSEVMEDSDSSEISMSSLSPSSL